MFARQGLVTISERAGITPDLVLIALISLFPARAYASTFENEESDSGTFFVANICERSYAKRGREFRVIIVKIQLWEEEPKMKFKVILSLAVLILFFLGGVNHLSARQAPVNVSTNAVRAVNQPDDDGHSWDDCKKAISDRSLRRGDVVFTHLKGAFVSVFFLRLGRDLDEGIQRQVQGFGRPKANEKYGSKKKCPRETLTRGYPGLSR